MANATRAVDRAEGCANRAQTGCWWGVLNVAWVVMLAAALYYGSASWQLTRNGASVEGVVVGYEEALSDGSTTYAPIVEYDVAGQRLTFASDNAASPPAYEIGERVPLRYNPANPGQARIDSMWELWLMPALLGPAALLLAVIGNVALLRAMWRGEAV